MTKEEFELWFAHHQAAFPGVASWFRKIPADVRPTTIGMWRTTLSRVDLESAKSATDAMLAESDRPRFYEDHPAAIIQRAKRNAQPKTFEPRRFVDGEESFSCLTCHDNGVVICWHPEAIRHFRNNGNVAGCRALTCVKACSCPSGDQFAQGYGVFNERRWLAYSADAGDENIARLKYFISNLKDSRREKAFDAFDR